jgi:molecular chaperone DnaK (HSP70)
VFDLGGGGLNVAVVCVHHELMEVKAHAHDPNLGGEGFDNMLVSRRGRGEERRRGGEEERLRGEEARREAKDRW